MRCLFVFFLGASYGETSFSKSKKSNQRKSTQVFEDAMFSTVNLNNVSGYFSLEMDALDISLLSKHHPSSERDWRSLPANNSRCCSKVGVSSVRWGESICDRNPLKTSYNKHRLTILIEVIYSTCIDRVFI